MRSGTCLPGTCPGTETSNYAVCPTQPNPAPEGRTETLQLTFFPQVLAWYIQYQNIYSKMYIPQPCARRAQRNPTSHIDPPSVGMIYSIPTYIFKNVHSPTLRPKGAQKPPTYIQPLSVGIIYPIPTYIFNWHIFPNPAPEGRTETLQLTFIPQVLAWYIQYQHITSALGGWM